MENTIFALIFSVAVLCLVMVILYLKMKLNNAAEHRMINLERNIQLLKEKSLLTARETEIIRDSVLGKSNQEIADNMFLSIQSVKNIKTGAFRKLNVKNTGGIIKKIILEVEE